MLPVHERGCKRRAVEIDGRAGDEAGPADLEDRCRAAGRNGGGNERLIQQGDRVGRGRVCWIDLNGQEPVVCAFAVSISHPRLKVPGSGADGGPADRSGSGIERETVRQRSAHIISGLDGTVIDAPLERRRAPSKDDGLAVRYAYRPAVDRLTEHDRIGIDGNLQRSAFGRVGQGGRSYRYLLGGGKSCGRGNVIDGQSSRITDRSEERRVG